MGSFTEEEKKIEALTKRELEVALLLREGYTNAKIAEDLFVSEGTIKKHISKILKYLLQFQMGLLKLFCLLFSLEQQKIKL